jgi:hypothetical protein
MMDARLLELGVGFIAALMVIREVLGFLEKKKNGSAGHSFIMNEHVNDVKGTVSAIKDKVDDLYDWHNKTDADGIPLWYVRRSLEESIRELGEKIYLQIEIQTEILRHMEKMEEHYRSKSRKEGSNGSDVAGPQS